MRRNTSAGDVPCAAGAGCASASIGASAIAAARSRRRNAGAGWFSNDVFMADLPLFLLLRRARRDPRVAERRDAVDQLLEIGVARHAQFRLQPEGVEEERCIAVA